MIYQLPTSQPSTHAAGKKPCAKCAKKQNGPLVLNGQTTGPIMPLGNNLFQQPTRRRTTTAAPQGRNLFRQTSQPASRPAAASTSRTRRAGQRGLHGLGQEDSMDYTGDLSLVDASLPPPPPDLTLDTMPSTDIAVGPMPDVNPNTFLPPGYSSVNQMVAQSMTGTVAPPGMTAAAYAQSLERTLGSAFSGGGQVYGAFPPGTSPIPVLGSAGSASWFSQQSLISGVPNWAIVAGGGALLMVVVVTAGKKRR